jgi:methylmalonyl-CoA mutase N-terminal domain/subunit
VRVAVQAMAAILGGTQSLHCNGLDEALGLPTESAARLALRTQQIIAAETGVANTVDPVGGSYVIEEMTDRIEREAAAIMERIDTAGGTLAAIEAGLIQREVQESAYKAQQAIDAATTVVVGVNRFGTDEATSIDVFQVDPEIERQQVERVRAVRASRDHQAWTHALARVKDVARGDGNVVPAIIAAVEARATVGEISDALRTVFGEHREIDTHI